ncbi:hypothetical protein [Litorivivens sp.]|uniref:hypothetical protein n=1 Tax=Litorivivens sp. TaxID=2020868 RepID=UPI003569AC95
MNHMNYTKPRNTRNVLMCLSAAISLAAPGTLIADSGYKLKPSISAFAIHDDNVFYTYHDKQSASIIRLTPSIEIEYEKQNLMWNAVYRIDAEEYTNIRTIDSGIVRRFADASVEYLPTSRLTLGADLGYTKTDTPADLSLVPGESTPGLLLGRINAERLTATPYIDYRLSPRIKGRLSYTHTEDNISDVLETDIRRAAIDMEHMLTPATTMVYGYFYRNVQYDEVASSPSNPDGQTSDSSGTTWLGLSHQLTPTTNTTVRAGVRSADGSSAPYWMFSVQREYQAGEINIGFERNETTAPGTTGSQEFETLTASISYRSGLNWLVTVTPSYAKVTQRSGEQKVYRLSVEATYRISNSWFLTASYERNYQPVDFAEITDEVIDRNVGIVGITYALSN